MLTHPRQNLHAASLISDTLGPLPVLAALCGAGALESSNALIGIAWGLLAMIFVAIAPYLLTWRIRHPPNGGRPSKPMRSLYMGLAVVGAGVGLIVLSWIGAPNEVAYVVVAVLASLVVAAASNALWRWSNHMAACASGVAMLAVLFGLPGLVSASALPLVAWARLALSRHTSAELVLGATTGAIVSATVLAALT